MSEPVNATTPGILGIAQRLYGVARRLLEGSRGWFVQVLCLFAVGAVINLPLIATPGYFSHDEIQLGARAAVDSISQIPWHEWSKISDFHYRPLTFNAWLLASYFLFDAPQGMHALLVAMHLANGLLLAWLVRSATGDRAFAVAAFTVFAGFPTGTVTAGWVGTIADMLSVGFTLTALAVQESRPQWVARGPAARATAYAVFLAACVGGFMSKEQFIVLPAVLLLLSLLRRKPSADLVAISGVLSGLYLLLRWAPLLSHPTASYTTSVANVPHNLLVFFAYPFSLGVTEAQHTLPPDASAARFATALLAHGLLIGLILSRGGARATLGYLGLFVLAVLPVLTIGGVFGHYLYTATTVLAIGVGWLLTRARPVYLRMSGVGLTVLALAHTVYIQREYWETGVIQSRIFTSLYSIVRTLGNESGITRGRPVVVLSSELNTHIIVRALHELTNLREFRFDPQQFTVVGSGAPIPANAIVLQFLPSGFLIVPSGCQWALANACRPPSTR